MTFYWYKVNFIIIIIIFIQEQVHQELDDIFQGEDRTITMNDIAEMKILERAIKETLRLYPSVPMIQRYTTESFQVGK